MADTLTPNYNFVQPEVGASNNTWGNKTNTNWASVDTLIKALNDALDAVEAAYVAGPNAATNNFPVAFDGVTGKLVKAITGAIAALHALTPAADRLPYFDGANSAALATLTAFARTILDDANGAAVFATLGATQSLGQSGQCKLPNGLIIKWGQATAVGGNSTITFPTAFPSTAYSCTLTCINEPANNSTAYYCWQDALSASGFNARARTILNGGTVTNSELVFQYVAVGV